MKPKHTILIIISLLLTYHDLLAQKKIHYGSNNGKYLVIFNKKIYYEEYGQGTPLILLEGGMKSISDFSLVIPELSKHFRVIAPDDPGQGRSEMLDTMTYDLLAEYVSKLIDILKLDSAYLMGWSDGGIAGLILATKRPEKIKKLIHHLRQVSNRHSELPGKKIQSDLVYQLRFFGKDCMRSIGKDTILTSFYQTMHFQAVFRFNNIPIAKEEHYRNMYLVE